MSEKVPRNTKSRLGKESGKKAEKEKDTKRGKTKSKCSGDISMMNTGVFALWAFMNQARWEA